MTSDVSLRSLPYEVLDQILESETLELNDVKNFALTCKQFYWSVTTSNKLWRRKFFQRWPHLRELLESEETTTTTTTTTSETPDWRGEARERILCARRLWEKLSLMSAKHYSKQELSTRDTAEYDELFLMERGARATSYAYLTDELASSAERPPEDGDLTLRYYASKVARYLKQTRLAAEWRKFLALPEERRTNESGAILVAEWSQPERRVSARRVSEMLDELAERAREAIDREYPRIGIRNVPPEVTARRRRENLRDNEWSNEDSRRIATVLRDVMFDELGYHGNSEMYYSAINSFIDQVLPHRRGIPITLAIVFESVARRLGIRCETVSFPAHFLLRWKERYIPRTKEDEQLESYYIDVFNGGKFLTRKSCSGIAGATRCPIEKYNVHSATSAIKVVQRMAGNLEVAARQRTQLNGRAARLRSALELLRMVKPRDTNTILHLGRFYMLHRMDASDLIGSLTDMLNESDDGEEDEEGYWRGPAAHILQMLRDYDQRTEQPMVDNPPKAKFRTPEVKYAVGMIMTDRLHNRCVITGWDVKCDREREAEYARTRVLDQPFYHVYVEDGSCRYAPQESLLITGSPSAVNHHEIGRYFCKFMGSYYLPNEEKAQEYPEDRQFCERMLRTPDKEASPAIQ